MRPKCTPTWRRLLKAGRIVDGSLEGERRERADAGNGHEAAACLILADKAHDHVGQDAELSMKLLSRFEQRFDTCLKIAIASDQFPHAGRKGRQPHGADLQAERPKRRPDMVFEIQPLVQQGSPATHDRPNLLAFLAFDMHCLESADAHLRIGPAAA